MKLNHNVSLACCSLGTALCQIGPVTLCREEETERLNIVIGIYLPPPTPPPPPPQGSERIQFGWLVSVHPACLPQQPRVEGSNLPYRDSSPLVVMLCSPSMQTLEPSLRVAFDDETAEQAHRLGFCPQVCCSCGTVCGAVAGTCRLLGASVCLFVC